MVTGSNTFVPGWQRHRPCGFTVRLNQRLVPAAAVDPEAEVAAVRALTVFQPIMPSFVPSGESLAPGGAGLKSDVPSSILPPSVSSNQAGTLSRTSFPVCGSTSMIFQ